MQTTLRLALAAATAAALVAPAAAAAQACNGTASFAAGKMRFSGQAAFVDGANTVGPNLAFGAQQGAFGNASFDVIQVDQIDSNGMRLGVGGGWQLPLGEGSRGGASRVQVCPVAAFGYTSGPDVGPASISGTDLSAGAMLGAAVSLSPTVDLVPFGGLSLVRVSSRVELDGESVSGSDTGGLLNFGSGLAFSQRYTARLSVGLPLSLGSDDTTIGLGFGVNFGGAPRR